MNDNQHKLEFLKAVREHGMLLHKLADGGDTTLSGPTSAPMSDSTKSGGVLSGVEGNLGLQNNFQATGAPLQSGTNTAQLQNAYTGAQSGISEQQDFLNALKGQNGVQNQSNELQQVNDIANGTGPNPAQTMLNEQTANNISNTASLMAGQRGASANPGMIARLAAQQGAQTQQNAIGQGASLQAQQQLNAINEGASIAGNQVANQAAATTGYNTAQQNEQSILQNANAGLNNATVGMQSNLNNVNGAVSAGNQKANSGLVGGVLSGISSAFAGLAKGGEVKKFDDGGKVPAPTTPASGSSTTSQAKEGFEKSGGFPSLDTIKNNLKNAWDGPQTTQPANSSYADGGSVQPRFNVQTPSMAVNPLASAGGPQSATGQYLSSQGVAPIQNSSMPDYGTGGDSGGSILGGAGGKGLKGMFGGNGWEQSADDAQEGYLDADAMLGATGADNKEIQLGGNEFAGIAASKGAYIGDKLKSGGNVPGKPKVSGKVNTEKNDNVPALLSPGEIVLPRSVTQSKDPANAAAAFVRAIQMKKQREAKRAS